MSWRKYKNDQLSHFLAEPSENGWINRIGALESGNTIQGFKLDHLENRLHQLERSQSVKNILHESKINNLEEEISGLEKKTPNSVIPETVVCDSVYTPTTHSCSACGVVTAKWVGIRKEYDQKYYCQVHAINNLMASAEPLGE